MNLEVHNEKKESTSFNKSGLGGWLIVTQIGLFLSLILNGIRLTDLIVQLSEGDTWSFFTDGFKSYLIFIIGYSILLLLFIIFILTQFYKKKVLVPKMMMIMYGVNLAVAIINFIVFQQVTYAVEDEIASLLKEVIQAGIAAAIWIPYFIKSKRVKNTFVN
ncbi:hypothetical protein J2Z32_003413 [Paenibacillus turicensis]|uniref:DUF2569 domain-containing protein n=2 Tax=Paenibacillus turicensis TaxID=160487 RepID=A0ABS4FWB4_9BACL|nr:hypothetical protein [Paenibacillus turicensis]